jgi:hypothetical protein
MPVTGQGLGLAVQAGYRSARCGRVSWGFLNALPAIPGSVTVYSQ